MFSKFSPSGLEIIDIPLELFVSCWHVIHGNAKSTALSKIRIIQLKMHKLFHQSKQKLVFHPKGVD